MKGKTMTEQEFIDVFCKPGLSQSCKTELDALIQSAIADHEAKQTVIKAKALRKKGTNRWYWKEENTINFYTLSEPDVKRADYHYYHYPKDAELVDIEIHTKP